MMREVIWQRVGGIGLEACRLARDGSGLAASGMMIAVDAAGAPLRCLYDIALDRHGAVRQVSIDLPGRMPAVLRLRGDGRGGWLTGLGEPLPAVAGASGVLIAGSPCGLGLALRALQLGAGAEAQLSLVEVALPDLHVQMRGLHVTCLAPFATGVGRFRVGGLGPVPVELETDGMGLPLSLPGQVERVLAFEAEAGSSPEPSIREPSIREPGLEDDKG